jgi:hypothetical protein
MKDRELIVMAVFRLRETSARLGTLANEANSPGLRVWLQNLARQLDEQGLRASLIVEAADEGDEVGAVKLCAP